MNARQLYIQDASTGKIRFTRAGCEKYGARFARAGFDIRKITSMQAFESAVDASFAQEMQQLASAARGEDSALDAVLAGLPSWN